MGKLSTTRSGITSLLVLSCFLLATFFIVFQSPIASADNTKPDSAVDRSDGCTVVTVGRLASADGSVMTSHTCDSHRTRSWFNIVPAKKHKRGSMATMVHRTNDDSLAMPAYKYVPIGEIPQVESTHGFINTAYPCMNDHQLGIGESTFGGRKTLKSDKGLIDCEQLVTTLMERCTTAREAVKLAGELTTKYGWIDEGECLSMIDTKEAWHFEIVGPGKGNVGSIWAAQRVPDEHVTVNANASRIRQIDLNNPDYFMASENVFTVAQDSGWWNPERGPFEFCYAYDPEGRTSFAATRREWRVFDLVAPSLKLHPNSENFPFSVKPDTLVPLEKMVAIFQDYYESTDYNFIKNITWVNGEGKYEISPLANPFMPYDMNKIFDINGGWGWRGERTIARWYTMYASILQSRDWLPDEVGGVAWIALDNVATSIYIPFYCCISDVSKYHKTSGRANGYIHDSGWWAFNRLGTLTAQRWGDMRHDVTAVWKPLQTELFQNQKAIEDKAQELLKKNRKKAIEFLTDYNIKWGEKVVERAWKLGDELWTKYDEKF
ncbi:MAG: peptidase C69 [Candidatus Latescibacteria bacterium]|nr:peptidase C69 [Candidatus Latescibacterota bacterium]NIM22048.1 peptidase C69 [Candidatus Latescibacterota bacterium]NIM66067.1 peptidase C69 [Candidatus Latescibacterota bacterium]NIO02475.1 peptidase C69 [Candidatus Latescibacterota bacterium]NIO29386.1 peptidase C69 [Candidatus Latescibacterota bacterium]